MRFRDAFKEFLFETKTWSPRLIVSLVTFCFGIFSGMISALMAAEIDWRQFPDWIMVVLPIALVLYILGHVYGVLVAHYVSRLIDRS